MSRKILCLFIMGLLVLTGVMSGCGGEEETEPDSTLAKIPPVPPVAAISGNPDIVKIGEIITFSGVHSTDSDGYITEYNWDFGDGQTASGETVTHTYSDRCGVFHVELTITDNDDLLDTAKVSVNVLMGIAVRIEATATTWREGEQPFDIYNAIKQKLEEAGFEVSLQESAAYDAILVIEYTEEKGSGYSFTGMGSPMGYGTRIYCTLSLYDTEKELIFENNIYASTPSESSSLYGDAVAAFRDKVYFKYIGDVIASIFIEGNEVSVLILALEDEDTDTQDDIVRNLVKIGESAVEPLIQALNNESEWVRMGATEALGGIGDIRAVEPLIQALEDEDKDVRFKAAIALRKIGDARAVEPLIKALNDEYYWVRSNAAGALGKIGDARAIEALEEALNDENSFVQRAAKSALEKIRGY